MLGTIVNTLAIIIGSLVGVVLMGGIPDRLNNSIMKALGLSVAYIGISGSLKTNNTLLLVISLVVGVIIGELLNIDQAINNLGKMIEQKVKVKGKNTNIAEGFVAASILFCVGSMAIVGSIQSGLQGDHSVLYVKSMLDGITSIIYASTMGIGVIFSAVAVCLYQGIITISAGVLSFFLQEAQIADVAGIGSILILALGLNMLEVTKIKVANFLPALLIPILYYGGLKVF